MFNRHATALLPTTAFVLLWSSGATVSEIGLRHGSPFALLILRYAIALVVLVAFASWNGKLLPERGSNLFFVASSIMSSLNAAKNDAMRKEGRTSQARPAVPMS